MTRRLYAALLVLAAPIAPLRAADVDALAAIDACTARLDAQVDVGYDRIAERCPHLATALEQSGWAAWLPQGWKESRNDLSAGSLLELRAVVQRELATRPTARTPRVERLRPILADLGDTGQQRSGAWVRFKKWLRSLFEHSGPHTDDDWLRRMVSRIGVSEATIEIITYIALGAVVVLAGFILFNELRLAGLLGRRRGEAAPEGKVAAWSRRQRHTWAEIDRAPLSDRPRLLLELIAARLTDLKRLPPASAFTVREITGAADLPEESDRNRLAVLALAAERVRYAQSDMEPAAVESAVGDGRELLTRLYSRERDANPAGAGA